MVPLRGVLAGAFSLAALGMSSGHAQDGNLAQQAQNPIANFISIPFLNNTNFNVGPSGEEQNILNIQPVIPVQAERRLEPGHAGAGARLAAPLPSAASVSDGRVTRTSG